MKLVFEIEPVEQARPRATRTKYGIRLYDLKKERSLRLSGSHRPVVKPDTDNYIKSTLDGLNGLLWEDDNQIVDLIAHKYYSDNPRVEVEVNKVCCTHKQ